MKQSSGIIQENTCVLPDRAFQVMGFQADVDQNTAPQHQSQGDQEENQIRPGGCLLLRSFAATALAFRLPRLWRIPTSPVQRLRLAPQLTPKLQQSWLRQELTLAPGATSCAMLVPPQYALELCILKENLFPKLFVLEVTHSTPMPTGAHSV